MRRQGKFNKIKYAYHLSVSFWQTCLVYFLCLLQAYFILFKLCDLSSRVHMIYYGLRFIIAYIQGISMIEWAMHHLAKRYKKGWALLTDKGVVTITPGYQRDIFSSSYDRIRVKVYGTPRRGPSLYGSSFSILDKKGHHCSHNISQFSSFLTFQAFYCGLLRNS